MAQPRKGMTFAHKTFLAQSGPRGSKAIMKITSVRKGQVYFTYASDEGNKAAWYLPVDVWVERYAS